MNFPKSQTLNIENCMIYSREIETFKCQCAHFAHMHSSFGCTDEKMDVGLYSETYGHFSKVPKSKN